jgi:RNA polymerase sigma factor (sigma-70 family)
MTSTQAEIVLQHIGRLTRKRSALQPPDADLLERFTQQRDEAAFAALVERHGPMVLNVCRSVLRHEHDAEDAFQATFLVLARKADAIRQPEALAGWLYEVAHNAAIKAQADATRRREQERRAVPLAPASPVLDMTLRDLQRVVHEELRRLPEKYRLPLVLCYLEDRSREEAAAQLGWSKGTVRGRLERGRERLRRRLAARGVALSALVGAAAVIPTGMVGAMAGPIVESTAKAAVPHLLTQTTVRAAVLVAAGQSAAAVVPAHVANLAGGMTRAVCLTKAKVAIVTLLAVGLLAAAGVLMPRPHAEGKETPAVQKSGPSLKEEDGRPAAKDRGEDKGGVEVRGRVLGPDGMPVASARLYWARILKEQPESEDDMTWVRGAGTGADGRFSFELPKKEVRAERALPLIAVADGLGAGWVELSRDKPTGDLTLRLVKDVPIRGRLLDTQGKRLAGVSVNVVGMLTTPEEKVDPFLTSWKQSWHNGLQTLTKRVWMPLDKVLLGATTDKEGHFEITGAGGERVVLLDVKGPGLARDLVYVVARPRFDPRPINEAVVASVPAELRIAGQPPTLYGPTFDYVAQPTRTIEGTVREVNTGKPIPGVRLSAVYGFGGGVNAVSDAAGHYKLAGLPKMKDYSVHAMPPEDGNLLSRSVRTLDDGGLGPVHLDVELARGVVLSGRIIDKATGKGLSGAVRFAPLPDNKFFGKPGYDSYRIERLMTPTKADGKFRLVVIPGSGVLMAQFSDESVKVDGVSINPYKQAEMGPTDRKRVSITETDDGDRYFTAAGNSLEFLTYEHACKVLDLDENKTAVTCDLTADPGTTVQVQVQDADGKPLPGAVIAGMTATWPGTFSLKGATCTVYALGAKWPRQLALYHAGRKLAGTLTVRGDEKGPLTVRLAPTGSVTARVLELDGLPIAGAEVAISFLGREARELFRELRLQHEPVRTDKDGRFRLEGVFPNMTFSFGIQKGRTFLVGEPRIGVREVAPGATLDLGERKVKAER